MKRAKKRTGSAYLVVLMIFLSISLFSTLMISSVNHSIARSHAHSLQLKAYYLNQEAQEVAVAVLRKDEDKLLKELASKSGAAAQRTDTMTHRNKKTNQEIGTSTITLKKEQAPYYGANEDWIVAEVTTVIPDERASKKGANFTFQAKVKLLAKNPIIQIYNTPVGSK